MSFRDSVLWEAMMGGIGADAVYLWIILNDMPVVLY